MESRRMLSQVINFPRQWLREVLIQCRSVGGLLRLLREEGGLHPRYTHADAKQKLLLEQFIRIEVGKGMLQDHDVFMSHWQKLGELIYDFSNEYGDEFNKLHKKN